jgi:GNAT superfamily N-acetyltransferase
VEIRTLLSAEREALLELLDCWEMPDGWSGRDFFRRYIEDDPSFRDENVWVAAASGRLISCVQIFPRALRVRSGTVPVGGIGSVFTHPEHRTAGVAGAVLARAEAAMRERGLALGMLFTGRVAWYRKLGWHPWPFANALYLHRGEPASPARAAEPVAFDAARDLAGVKAIHTEYCLPRDGTVVRDDPAWEGSLRVAGNPDEDFLVVRHEGAPAAYARLIALEGHPVLAEFGRRKDAAQDLAALLSGACAARRGAYGPAPGDPELERAGRPVRHAALPRPGGAARGRPRRPAPRRERVRAPASGASAGAGALLARGPLLAACTA